MTLPQFTDVLSKVAPDELDSLKKWARALAKSGLERYIDEADSEDEDEEEEADRKTLNDVDRTAQIEKDEYIGELAEILERVKAKVVYSGLVPFFSPQSLTYSI